MAGISKIDADKIAVTSAASALDSTQAGYKAGTKTLLDVLTSEQNVYQAKTNLSADLYSYINNTLALKEAAGSLSGVDMVGINHWLQDKPIAPVHKIKHKRKKLKRAKKTKAAKKHHHLN